MKNNFQYQIVSGFINEKLHYNNPQATINSNNSSYLVDNNVNTTLFLKKNWKIVNNLNLKYEAATADNFTAQNNRLRTSWLFGINKIFFKKLTINAFNRSFAIQTKLKPIAPGFGLQYKPLNRKAFMIKANTGVNYHYPTFNDLFWKPGGNPNLKPEQAKMVEGGLAYAKRTNKIELNTEFTVFYAKVKDWIIWLPTEYGYWSPTNLKDVANKGIETKLSISTKINKLKFKASVNHAYTKSTNLKTQNEFDNSRNKQLIYVPYHKLNSSLQLNYNAFYLIYTYNYVGERFISTDNNWKLPANFISDISIAKRFKAAKKWSMHTSFKIRNILDQNYQSIAWRPMPGRNFLLSLTIQFNS